MAKRWLPFRRRASYNHILEAKVAEGGEPYGHPNLKLKAEAGQWICRNPENGYCWVMSNEGMAQLYVPFDTENEDWKALIERLESQKKKRVKTKKPTQKKKRSSDSENDPSLF